LYPVELDLLFVEPMIFEVLKKPNGSASGLVSYDVRRLFTHERLLDVFYGPKNYSPIFIVEVCHCRVFYLFFIFYFPCYIVYILYCYAFFSGQAMLLC